MDALREFDLAVVGAGPAGSAAAITAARHGARVLLLERGSFPRHKVCGEFVSAESLELLAGFARDSAPLAALLAEAQPLASARVLLDNKVWELPVEPPAASLPRFDLDAALWELAARLGAECRQQVAVTAAGDEDGGFRLETSAGSFRTRSLINASGRWSNLTPASGQHRQAKGPKWLGVKAYFRERTPAPGVDLYFFRGGYCGVQPVGAERINACAMVRSDAATTMKEVLAQHPLLQERSRGWEALTEPVSTSPLIFRKPASRQGAVLLAGDAAGFVDPFVGDGISMALRGGAMAAETLSGFWAGRVSLEQAARLYERLYREQMAPVFRAASRLRQVVSMPRVLRAPILRLLNSPATARYLVRKTRARPAHHA